MLNKFFFKTIILISLLLFSFRIAYSDDVIAKDDIYTYTKSDLAAQLNFDNLSPDEANESLKKNTLSNLCFKKLYVYEIEKDKKTDPKSEILIRETLKNFANNIFVKELLDECNITTDVLKKEYEKNKELYKTQEKRKVSVLYKLFPKSESEKSKIIDELKELRKKPDLNKNFLEYVKKHSDLPGATDGGIVDYFVKGTYGPIFEKYAFNTPKDEISEVFSATNGAYIIKCLDIKPQGYKPFLEVASQLRNKLKKDKVEKVREKKINELKTKFGLKMTDYIPKNISPDFVLFKVKDYEYKFETFRITQPEAAEEVAPESENFKKFLNITSEGELILQYIMDKAKKEPKGQIYYDWEIIKTNVYFQRYSNLLTAGDINVSEGEARAYYEKVKDFYHDVAPKKFGYLVLKYPGRSTLSEPEFFKKLEWQKRALDELREKMVKETDNFKLLAKEFTAKNPDAIYAETNFVKELPPEWGLKTSITEYSEKIISPVYKLGDHYLIFKVVEIGKAKTLPYSEVKDKVQRVVWGDKYNKIINDTKEKLLKKYNFKFIN